jgi:hypothetical protein
MATPEAFLKAAGAVLPKPEQVVAALASFPPKLSVLQSIPAAPEALFESMVKSATGVELPPGPNRMLQTFMAGVEAAVPAMKLPFAGGEGPTVVSGAPTASTGEKIPRKFVLL